MLVGRRAVEMAAANVSQVNAWLELGNKGQCLRARPVVAWPARALVLK